MKRSWRLCALAGIVSAIAAAYDFTALKPEGYVSDFARVVDPASRAAIERYCRAVENATGAQIAIVTLESLQGEPVEDVADALFRKWGVGQKGANEGILLLLSVRDRRSRLEVGYGLEPIIPDGFAGSLLREMRPALRESHYGDAVITAVREIGSRVAEAKKVQIAEAPPRPQRRRAPESSIPIPILLGGIFLLFLLFAGSRGGGYGGGGGGWLPALILGNMIGRASSGGRGSGGFGGFDSGDGFGGFGGGDSGGGGASSDW